MVSAQGLPAELVGTSFEHSIETWKSGHEGGYQDGARAVGPWQASLGTSAALTFRVPGSDGWHYQATLTDGETTVEGVATSVGERVTIRFDVDGQRPLLDQAEIPALLPGLWRYHITGFPGDGPLPPTNPAGSASGVLETDTLRFLGVLGADGFLPGMSLPEDLLPNIREVGAGKTTWMPTKTMPSLAMAIQGTPGANVTLRGWSAAGPGAAEPLPALPVDLTEALDPGTQWTRIDMPRVQLGPQGDLVIGIPPDIGNRLVVMSAVSENGGSATWVLGFGNENYQIESVLSEPGSEGSTRITRTGPAGRPAAIHAISTDRLTETAAGGRVLATGGAIPDDQDHWQGAIDGRATRSEQVAGYHLLSWFLDPEGNYLGHAVATRGLDVQMQADERGLAIGLEHLRSDDTGVDPANTVRAAVTASIAGRSLGTQTVHVPQGGLLTVDFEQALAPGVHEAHVVIDTGDLYFARTASLEVPEPETGLLERAPSPLPLLPLLGLLLLRKREI